MEKGYPGRMHPGDFVNRGPSGGQDTAASESNVGIVGGTVEDVNGACSGFEFRNLALGVPYQVTATTTASRSSRSQRDAHALCADRVLPGGYRRGDEYSGTPTG
jgi:hypothetical protein